MNLITLNLGRKTILKNVLTLKWRYLILKTYLKKKEVKYMKNNKYDNIIDNIASKLR